MKIANIKQKLAIVTMTIAIFACGMVSFAHKETNTNENIAYNTEIHKVLSSKPVVTNNKPNNYICVQPLKIVENPSIYLNKQVKFQATFDKFSTLGLDYKPAFRDSEKYISFLIKRDDVTDHTIPLSEMKIFIKRSEAEKFIDLDSGDVIEVYGKVFSNALTDAWIDVEKLVVITKKNKQELDKA